MGPSTQSPETNTASQPGIFSSLGPFFFSVAPFEHLCLPPALISSTHDATVASELSPSGSREPHLSPRNAEGHLFKHDLKRNKLASHKESGRQVRDVAHFFLIQLFIVFNHIHNHSPHMSHKVPALEETLKSLFKFKRTVQSLSLKWSIVETCEAARTLASGHS